MPKTSVVPSPSKSLVVRPSPWVKRIIYSDRVSVETSKYGLNVVLFVTVKLLVRKVVPSIVVNIVLLLVSAGFEGLTVLLQSIFPYGTICKKWVYIKPQVLIFTCP